MRIFIEPTEPLLFRTGRSFNAGESNFAETIFPPTPETMQGAIRAMIAAHTSLVDSTMSIATRFGTATLTNLIGDRSHYGRFRITGLALGKYTKEDGLVRLFPAPAPLIKVRFRGDKDPTIVQLKPQELPGIINDRLDTMQYLTPPDFDKRGEVEGKPKSKRSLILLSRKYVPFRCRLTRLNHSKRKLSLLLTLLASPPKSGKHASC